MDRNSDNQPPLAHLSDEDTGRSAHATERAVERATKDAAKDAMERAVECELERAVEYEMERAVECEIGRSAEHEMGRDIVRNNERKVGLVPALINPFIDHEWSRVLSQSPVIELSSLHPQPLEPPHIVSASFRNRSVKTNSYFFSDIGLDGNSSTSKGESDSVSSDFASSTTHPNQSIADQTGSHNPADYASSSNSSAPGAGPTNATEPETETTHGESKNTSDNKKRTRILPPTDVIKLQDRLFYMLQPPLESLLDGATMEFPFEPFGFQYAGIAFLYPRYNAILADEMGLGKTMQAITAIRMLLRTGHIKNVLLISPKPLVTNWQREFQTWAPEITVAAISGNQHQRAWHWKSNPAMVKVANYELLTRDEKHVTDPAFEYDLVVLDEAQRVKNKSNATSQVVQKIPRKRSWALTGTPIENGIEDLVGICEFASPGTVRTGMTPREVRGRVRDLILRRTKDVVMKDMPPRLMRDAELDLSADQWDTYQSAENDGVIKLNAMGDELTIKHVFELVLRLKQICNFDPVTQSSSKMDRLAADMEEVAASGQKAIVFSQWVNAIEVIADKIPQHNPLQYHGRIPSKQRDPILEEFRNNPDRHVLLMSYGAGSVGLNLQFCRYVFLFDRWWNPAIEDQAINRAHRIGAAGSVTITRMIMAGTIEQRIHDILEAKRELFREILSGDEAPSKRGLTKDEIFGLFNLRTPQGKIVPKPDTDSSSRAA